MATRRRAALWRYAAARLLQSIPLILAMVVVAFGLVHLAPGDPIDALTGDFPVPEAQVAQLREKFGLDLPFGQQLLRYISTLVRGDLGFSFAHGEPVSELIVDRLRNTALLVLTGIVIALIAGLPLGVVAATRRGTPVDNLVSVLGVAGFSAPVFWLGQLLILAFALHWALLPASGMVDLRAPASGMGRYLDIGRHLVLPALTLSFRYMALFTRVTRASMIDALESDFILTARSKGLSQRAVVVRHALRNAMLPIVTVVGYELGFLFSGSVLVETVFAWPGVGRLLYDAILVRDTPMVLGIFVVIGLGVIVVNLIVDIAYSWLDPRIRYAGRHS